MRATIIALVATIVVSAALLFIGISNAAAGAMIPAVLCGAPMFGFFVGRLSMMIEIVPRERERPASRRSRQPSGTVLN